MNIYRILAAVAAIVSIFLLGVAAFVSQVPNAGLLVGVQLMMMLITITLGSFLLVAAVLLWRASKSEAQEVNPESGESAPAQKLRYFLPAFSLITGAVFHTTLVPLWRYPDIAILAYAPLILGICLGLFLLYRFKTPVFSKSAIVPFLLSIPLGFVVLFGYVILEFLLAGTFSGGSGKGGENLQ